LQIDTDPAAALVTADRCVAIAPTLPDGHFVRGRALAALGRLHAARDAYGCAIAAGRHAADHFVTDGEIPAWRAAFETALTLMREERWQDALAWLEFAQRARPVMQIVINRARCCEMLGDLATALALFRAALDGYRDELAAIEYVNFVFRHGSPDIALLAVEQALPVVGDDYRRAFLATAAARFVQSGRRPEAAEVVARALAIGGDPGLGRAVVDAMADHYGVAELRAIGREPAAVLA
jgi:tetratricopeptide (TPR) repeat protein